MTLLRQNQRRLPSLSLRAQSRKLPAQGAESSASDTPSTKELLGMIVEEEDSSKEKRPKCKDVFCHPHALRQLPSVAWQQNTTCGPEAGCAIRPHANT